jgi:hypothetical protein
MKVILTVVSFCCAVSFLFVEVGFAATVSCEVKEVSGSVLVLENCDIKRVQDFKKGSKVKVKLQKKQK